MDLPMLRAILWLLFMMAIVSAIVAVVSIRMLQAGVRGVKRGLCLALLGLGLVAIALVVLLQVADARDDGQWQNGDQAVRQWYQELMRPDAPTASCCGEADAYWADDYYFRDGKAYARITDDRPDEPRGRPHVEIGTEIEIPNEKLKWDRANPTGHGIVFLSRSGLVVFCYVQPGGA